MHLNTKGLNNRKNIWKQKNEEEKYDLWNI